MTAAISLLTRRKTWVGEAQPGFAFCPHPPKSSPPRLTDVHAPLCAAAERCLALRSVPEERVDLVGIARRAAPVPNI